MVHEIQLIVIIIAGEELSMRWTWCGRWEFTRLLTHHVHYHFHFPILLYKHPGLSLQREIKVKLVE